MAIRVVRSAITRPVDAALNTRDVQQLTGGFWYDFYKGPKGRLREGFQYAYAVRQSWSGAPLSGQTDFFQIKGMKTCSGLRSATTLP